MRNFVNSINPFIDSLFFTNKDYDTRLMRTDIIEHDADYVLKVEVGDVEKKDVKISLVDSKLTISITKNEDENETGSYLLKERRYGTYSRSYYVGDDVQFKNISAKLENGLLTLTILKAKEEEKEEKFVEIL
ncbi:MAG: Hsp20 family protein [Bacilli bacterium]|nr:Hsp20 family protein [Bacilli bacterium]